MTWTTVALGDVVGFKRQTVQPASLVTGTHYIGLENLTVGGGLAEVSITHPGELKSAKFAFDDRHVLFGKLRPNLAKVARPDFSGICSTDILPLLPTHKMDRNYLAHFLLYPKTVEWAASRTSGANLPRLSPAILSTLEIPLPPLAEQRRVAAVLDRADALRRARRASVQALDRLLDASFHAHFASGASETTVPMESLLAPERGAIRTGPFGSQLLHSEFVAEGVPVLGIDNVVTNTFTAGKARYVTPEKYAELSRYTVFPGDVLITIMGTVGRCAVVPVDIGTAINTKHLCCITLDKSVCLPEYLQNYFLRHPVARNYLASVSKGAIMDGLNMGLIRAMPVVLPSLDRQQAFTRYLESIERVRDLAQAHLGLLDELFGSLQHRAFEGSL
jgi:type I restriction enzyme S subunit